jgi:carbonyl reductase 1
MADSERELAVVTGANRGLGLETSRGLARVGQRVIMTARDPVSGSARARELQRTGADVEFQPLDVSDQSSIAAFREFTRTRLGRIDVLVNNAGVSLNGFNVEVVRRTLAVNFFGPLLLTQALLPLIPSGGIIVMVSSGMGELSGVSPLLRARFSNPALGVEGLVELVNEFTEDVASGCHGERGWPSSAYRVSKVALNALTRIWARELVPRGIRINAVCPGWVRTRMGGAGASRSVEQGAYGIIWAATLPADGPSGGFFRDGRPIDW